MKTWLCLLNVLVGGTVLDTGDIIHAESKRYAWITGLKPDAAIYESPHARNSPDMEKVATDPESKRGWKETNRCQIPLHPATAKGKIWSDMKEVYFLQ